jgi:hypothetical protein
VCVCTLYIHAYSFSLSLVHSFIHCIICITSGPYPFQSEFSTECCPIPPLQLQYPLFSLRSSSNWLRLLLHLPVTSILPSVFPFMSRFRRQFVLKMWPVQLAFLLFLNVRYVHNLDGVWTVASLSLALQAWATAYCCERRTWFINNFKQRVVNN